MIEDTEEFEGESFAPWDSQAMKDERAIMKTTLPNTRNAITHSFTIDDIQGYVTVGLNEQGQPMEIFVKVSKEGSTLGGMVSALARLASIALQYGVPLDYLCQKMKGHRFEPMGLTLNKDIPQTNSIVDYIFTWVEQRFILTKTKNENDL